MIKEATCRRVPEWLPLPAQGWEWGEDPGKLENLCVEVHFDDRKLILKYHNKSAISFRFCFNVLTFFEFSFVLNSEHLHC